MISILAVVLTAPFLFDFLNRFMIVRSTVKRFESFALSGTADGDRPLVVAGPTAREGE